MASMRWSSSSVSPEMVTIDYVILGIMAISALIGLVRGFVREVLSLATWVAAIVLALAFSDRVAPQLAKYVEVASMQYVAAFALIFVATLLTGAILQWLVARLVQSTGLSGTDRLVGVVFGGLRGAVVCIVAAIALRPFVADQAWWQASTVIPALHSFEADVLRIVSSTGKVVGELRQET
jgi:membrane protein required for colicin V production